MNAFDSIKKVLNSIKKILVRIVDINFFRPKNVFAAFQKLKILLEKPWWNGVGVIATIILAISIFIAGQNIEGERYESGVANMEISNMSVIAVTNMSISDSNLKSVFTSYENWAEKDVPNNLNTSENDTSNKWVAIIFLINKGPADAKNLDISIEFGNIGIKPIRAPIIIGKILNARVVNRGQLATSAGRYSMFCDIIVDNLLVGYDVVVIQEFTLDNNVDSQFRNGPFFHEITYYLNNNEIAGYAISEPYFVAKNISENFIKFVPSIKTLGTMIRQNWKWDNKYSFLLNFK